MRAIQSVNSYQSSCHSNILLNSDKYKYKENDAEKNKNYKSSEISKMERLTCALRLFNGSVSTMCTSNNPAKKIIFFETTSAMLYFYTSICIVVVDQKVNKTVEIRGLG